MNLEILRKPSVFSAAYLPYLAYSIQDACDFLSKSGVNQTPTITNVIQLYVEDVVKQHGLRCASGIIRRFSITEHDIMNSRYHSWGSSVQCQGVVSKVIPLRHSLLVWNEINEF